jgi:hypothetical protein
MRLNVFRNKYINKKKLDVSMILYSNGILESYRPKEFTFTEDELVHLFTEFKEIKTHRLSNVLNTWCIYGSISPIPDPIELNRIASDIIKKPVYSHLLFIHDSELNPKWSVTDSILYKSYDEFTLEITKLIDFTANNILQEYQSRDGFENAPNYLPQLISLGTTVDKKILFGFNPNDQTKEFYEHDEFYIFLQKVYDYLTKHKQQKIPFTIYADKKAIIIIDPQYVISFLNRMLEKFKSREEYEICTNITKMIQQWPSKEQKKPRKNTSTEK